MLGGSVAFVAPDDSLAWLDEDDAFTQTGDNLLKLMTVARLTKISDPSDWFVPLLMAPRRKTHRSLCRP